MRKMYFLLALASAFTLQPAFADDTITSSDSKPCGIIAKACISAGYTRHGNGDKKFWFGCMKPVVLGQTVKGVTVDAATVKSCRQDKITELKKELNEFENVSAT